MTSDLILHGDYLSPYTVSVVHALLEKGLSWEYKHVNILTFETRTPEHRQKHPFGKIPVLDAAIDGGKSLRVYESRAIARYIASAYSKVGNPLVPAPNDLEACAAFEEAASVEVCYFSTTAWKFCGELLIKPILGFPAAPEQAIQDLWNELDDTLKRLDEILSGRSHLAGEQFTLVDIWSMPWISHLIDVKGWEVIFHDRPHLCDWWKRVSSRPAWLEALKLMNGAFEALKRDEAK